MKTKVFAYKGYIGIKGGKDFEGTLASPYTNSSNLGFVMDASEVEFSEEAIKLLKTVKKSRDSLGTVDIYQATGKIIFSWLGGPLQVFKPEDVDGSRSYDPNLIKSTKDVEIDEEFVKYVDSK